MEIQVIEAEELNTLPELKRNEIGAVSNNIMASISVWKTKLSEVTISDPTDSESMKLAEKIRLDVKKERCSQEKVIDDLRDDVKIRMIEQKTEDEVLLAIKKAVVAQYKEIEAMAEHMANTAKRHEAEQKQKTGELRIEKVKRYNENVTIIDVLNLTDEMFEIVLAGYEKTYQDKQEAIRNEQEEKEQQEKQEALHNTRKVSLLNDWQFVSEEEKVLNFGTISDGDWETICENVNTRKVEHQHQIEAEKAEKEALKAKLAEQEAEEAKRKNAEEDAKAKEAIELKTRIIEFAKLLTENGFTKSEDGKQFNKGSHFITVEKLYIYTKEQLLERFAEIDQLIETNRKAIEAANKMAEQSRILEEKEAAEKAEKARLTAEQEAAEKARIEAEKAPILDKLNLWVDNVVIATPPIENEATIEIMKRFEGFKSWAKQVINK